MLTFLVFTLLVAGLHLGVAELGCDHPWMYNFDSCWMVMTRGGTQDQARTNCMRYRGDLASITSQEEQNWISRFVDATAWIGLNDKIEEDTFVWTDSHPLNYTMWAANNPKNGSDSVHCVAMSSRKHEWINIKCNVKLPRVVCKTAPHDQNVHFATKKPVQKKQKSDESMLAPLHHSLAAFQHALSSYGRSLTEERERSKTTVIAVVLVLLAIIVGCGVVFYVMLQRRRRMAADKEESTSVRYTQNPASIVPVTLPAALHPQMEQHCPPSYANTGSRYANLNNENDYAREGTQSEADDARLFRL